MEFKMTTVQPAKKSLSAPDTPLYRYLVDHQPIEHDALRGLRLKTQGMEWSIMQITPDQGHFMAFLVKLVGAARILEVGTFTGYSALAMALALPPHGKLVTCDINEVWG